MLIALLAIVAGGGQLLWGILLLFLYAVGHGMLSVIAGTSVGFVQKLSASQAYGKASQVLKILMGAAMLIMGLYMFYLGF
jgi:cytochrome c biogenesis protein CcdA